MKTVQKRKSSGSVTLKRNKKAALGTYHKGIKDISNKKAPKVKLVHSK
ncbi:hypothetical protein [Virgibacillus siamensis]|nr:hypothetical protein [Virgibacillus siamensis]